MDINAEIIKLKKRMREQEISDDGYYLSRQYKEDRRTLYQLKCALKMLNEHIR